jgi:hypothetical protein
MKHFPVIKLFTSIKICYLTFEIITKGTVILMDEIIKIIFCIWNWGSKAIVILTLLTTGYLYVMGIFPALYRLGTGLAERKIALFAESEYTSLRKLLVDSELFKDKNVVQIHRNSINSAENHSLFVVYWAEFSDKLDDILRNKKDNVPLIIYAPQDKGRIEPEDLETINQHRNVIIVNFRGRLINDILVSLMTTGFKK